MWANIWIVVIGGWIKFEKDLSPPTSIVGVTRLKPNPFSLLREVIIGIDKQVGPDMGLGLSPLVMRMVAQDPDLSGAHHCQFWAHRML